MASDGQGRGALDYGNSSRREKMLHLASIIRHAALIRPFGPNSKAAHEAGGCVMLTPAESEAAADAILASDWMKAHDAEVAAAALRDAAYNAWEQGWAAGCADAKGQTRGLHANPYRSTKHKADDPEVHARSECPYRADESNPR